MHLSRVHPRYYSFGLDNCLLSLTVNGIEKPVPADFCDYHAANVLDLGDAIHAGENTLALRLENGGGPAGIRIEPANTDPLILWIRASILLCFAGGFLSVFLRANPRKRILLVVLLGIALRVAYVWVTPYWLRGYDVAGHMQYLSFMSSHWSIPPPHEGWEYYQPPLYYMLAALILKASSIVPWPFLRPLLPIETFSLVLSIGVLCIAAWIGTMVWQPKKDSSGQFLFYLGYLAVLPSLIFFSSRINNDVLFNFFAFLSLALLIRWWKDGRSSSWLLLCLALGIGLLSKANMFLMLPAVVVCLMARRGLSVKNRLQSLVLLALVLLLLAGWQHIPRYLAEEDKRLALVGNMDKMTGPIPRELRYFTQFNPLIILHYPFNDTNGLEAHRSYMWEYFYRTIFFGEFPFSILFFPLGVLIVGFGMFFIPVVLWNFLSDIRRWNTSISFPLWTTLFFQIVGLTAYRIIAPFSCNGDARFVMVCAVPLSFYAVSRFGKFPAILEHTRRYFSQMLISACIAFLLLLVLLRV